MTSLIRNGLSCRPVCQRRGHTRPLTPGHSVTMIQAGFPILLCGNKVTNRPAGGNTNPGLDHYHTVTWSWLADVLGLSTKRKADQEKEDSFLAMFSHSRYTSDSSTSDRGSPFPGTCSHTVLRVVTRVTLGEDLREPSLFSLPRHMTSLNISRKRVDSRLYRMGLTAELR
ncbi:hypothetical protein FKM82_020965 [Ascaphus truei]